MKIRPILYILIASTIIVALLLYAHLYTERISNTRSLLVYTPPTMYPPISEYAEFFKRSSGVEVYIAVGPTGTLISKIDITRKGDVLFTADHVFMERAINMGIIERDSVRVVSYVIPAIIVHRGNPHNISDLQDLVNKQVRIGTADPEGAPFGRIAVEILKRAGVYDAVKDRLVIYTDVLVVARQLALKRVDVAILPYIVKYWYPGELDIVWIQASDLRGLVSCQLVGVVVFSEDKNLSRDFISSFRAWLREKSSVLRYVVDLGDLAAFTPYDPRELEFPSICLGE